MSFWTKGKKQPRSAKQREAMKGKGARYGQGLPVFSVDIEEDARDLMVLTCSLGYDKRHIFFKPGVFGDFDGEGDVEDLDKVTACLAETYAILKKRKAEMEEWDDTADDRR